MTKESQNKGENKSPERDEKGRLLPGAKLGKLGGRPKGSLNLLTIARKKAEESGTPLEERLWEAIEALFERVKNTGDPAAAKLLFNRLCGAVPDTSVAIDARSINMESPRTGPPVPSRQEMVKYLNELAATSARLAQVENEVDFPTNPGKPKGKPGHNGGKT